MPLLCSQYMEMQTEQMEWMNKLCKQIVSHIMQMDPVRIFVCETLTPGNQLFKESKVEQTAINRLLQALQDVMNFVKRRFHMCLAMGSVYNFIIEKVCFIISNDATTCSY